MHTHFNQCPSVSWWTTEPAVKPLLSYITVCRLKQYMNLVWKKKIVTKGLKWKTAVPHPTLLHHSTPFCSSSRSNHFHRFSWFSLCYHPCSKSCAHTVISWSINFYITYYSWWELPFPFVFPLLLMKLYHKVLSTVSVHIIIIMHLNSDINQRTWP